MVADEMMTMTTDKSWLDLKECNMCQVAMDDAPRMETNTIIRNDS
jgi:hypothetical protein